MKVCVTVWNEYRHEKSNPKAAAMYPDGIHNTIARLLNGNGDMAAGTATLDEADCGLPDAVLDNTDVLIWWGHKAHREVPDELVDKIQNRVLCGMGLIALHSAHNSKIFKRLMGTSCSLKWRDIAEKERVWVLEPSHPIAAGLGEYVELEHEEMYGERFDIPAPDTLVFASWFKGGELFRSGCCYTRGCGRIFYLRPGHEEYPTFHNPDIARILVNAVRWAAPAYRVDGLTCPNVQPLD